MSAQDHASPEMIAMPNGSGAAAVLAAGVGSFAVALFALAADKVASFKSAMIFYRPTGPLSGVTTLAITVWLVVWVLLHMAWRKRAVSITWTTAAACALLFLSLLLTFPPIADIF